MLLQILYEETLYQKGPDGTLVVKQLQDKGVLLGIKVDKGVAPLFGTDGETTVQVSSLSLPAGLGRGQRLGALRPHVPRIFPCFTHAHALGLCI